MRSRTLPPGDGDPEAAALGHVRGRRHRGSDLPKYYAIKTVAEALDVSPRTVRRWIADGDLVVHRRGGIVRVAESDLRTFLAMHREG
jgi:excisionase family DNA binding protein